MSGVVEPDKQIVTAVTISSGALWVRFECPYCREQIESYSIPGARIVGLANNIRSLAENIQAHSEKCAASDDFDSGWELGVAYENDRPYRAWVRTARIAGCDLTCTVEAGNADPPLASLADSWDATIRGATT